MGHFRRLNKQFCCFSGEDRYHKNKTYHISVLWVITCDKNTSQKNSSLPLPLWLITHLMQFHTTSCCSGLVWPSAPDNRVKAVSGERVHQSGKLGSTTSSLFTWNSRAQPQAVTSPIQHAEIIRQHRNSRQTVLTQWHTLQSRQRV